MEIIDNVNKTLKEDLTTEIHKGSKVSIAAACFSIYAFAELKKELKNVDELRFIFTSPTFIKEKAKREKREFYIPRQEREKNLFGSEFEVKLRNEMTQKAIAKECAEWIRKKAVFKSNVTNENMMGFINVDDKNYMPLSGFTTVDLGCERGNNAYYMVQKSEAPMSTAYLQLFEQLVNFWPNITLDEYINLKARVETRMKIVDMTATGDDNVLSPEEKGDLEYRKQQLKRLQEEVVDIEDMSSGISIMDLGLNEFRLDLLDYIKTHPEIEKAPHGMNAVVKATEELPAGVIFVLRNIKNEVNINSQNRLHPFYMVYMSEEGEVIIDHLSPKEMLDSFRLLCKGKKEPDKELCAQFNDETDDGRKMGKYSDLLGNVVASIIELKDESDIDNFLGGSQVSFLGNEIKGLNDFELISFLIVK